MDVVAFAGFKKQREDRGKNFANDFDVLITCYEEPLITDPMKSNCLNVAEICNTLVTLASSIPDDSDATWLAIFVDASRVLWSQAGHPRPPGHYQSTGNEHEPSQ